MHAWRQQQHLQILQEKENKGKGRATYTGPEGAESYRLRKAFSSSQQLLGVKAKYLNHRRRCGKYGVLPWVISRRGDGTDEHGWSEAGGVAHIQELGSP